MLHKLLHRTGICSRKKRYAFSCFFSLKFRVPWESLWLLACLRKIFYMTKWNTKEVDVVFGLYSCFSNLNTFKWLSFMNNNMHYKHILHAVRITTMLHLLDTHTPTKRNGKAEWPLLRRRLMTHTQPLDSRAYFKGNAANPSADEQSFNSPPYALAFFVFCFFILVLCWGK